MICASWSDYTHTRTSPLPEWKKTTLPSEIVERIFYPFFAENHTFADILPFAHAVENGGPTKVSSPESSLTVTHLPIPKLCKRVNADRMQVSPFQYHEIRDHGFIDTKCYCPQTIIQCTLVYSSPMKTCWPTPSAIMTTTVPTKPSSSMQLATKAHQNRGDTESSRPFKRRARLI